MQCHFRAPQSMHTTSNSYPPSPLGISHHQKLRAYGAELNAKYSADVRNSPFFEKQQLEPTLLDYAWTPPNQNYYRAQKQRYPLEQEKHDLSHHKEIIPWQPNPTELSRDSPHAQPTKFTQPCSDQPPQHLLLDILVYQSTLRKKISLRELRTVSTAKLLEKALKALGLPVWTNSLLLNEGRVLTHSKSITLSEAVDLGSTSHVLLLELRCLASLVGGMFSMSSADDDNNFQRAPEQIVPPKETKAPLGYNSPSQQLATEVLDKLRDPSTKLMDFVKLREKQQSGEITKATLQYLPEAELTKFMAYITKESFKQEDSTYEAVAKADKKKIRKSVTLEIPQGQFHHHDPHDVFKEDFWNYSIFIALLGINSFTFARIENHETVVTDIDYQLSIGQIPGPDWDHEKPLNIQIEEKRNELEWIRKLVYYRYSPTTKAIDSFSSHAIDKVNLIPMFKNYIHALFPGSDGSVFWFSGKDKDELNIHKLGEAEHQQYKIGKESLFYQFVTEGNSYSKSGRIVPVQLPQMKVFEGNNQVIVFSRFVYGELPSVCFYSPEKGREILQCQGSSMLVHTSLTADPSTQTHSCLFYANPFFCSQPIADEKAIHNEKEGDLWNTEIDKTLTPPIKRQEIDIAAALSSEVMVQLDLQEDFKLHQSKFMSKEMTLEKAQEILKNELQAWILVPKLQFDTISQTQWLDQREILVEQFEGSDNKKFFILSKSSIAAICEIESPNQVNVLHNEKKPAVHSILHDQENQKFRVFSYFHDVKKWTVADVSEDRAKVEKKAPEEQKIHHGHDAKGLVGLCKGVEPLSVMISERLKMAKKQVVVDPDNPYSDCFKLIMENLSQVEWQFKHFYPFHTMMNRHQPDLLYIIWRTNRKSFVASFDLGKLGQIYSVPQETSKHDGFQACITALIEGFEPDNKLTRLEFRIEDFCWNAMQLRDIKFSATVRKYQRNTVRADRFGRLLLKGMIIHGEESGFYIYNLATIQAIDDEQTPADPVYQTERGQQLNHEWPYIACDPAVFVVADYNTKTSYMASFSKPNLKYEFITEFVTAQRCPENEQKEAFADIDPVILVFDGKFQLHKVRVSNKNGGKIEKIAILDLSETCCQHVNRGETIMSRTGMLHDETWCSNEFDHMQEFNHAILIRDEQRQIHEDCRGSNRVPNSDQIMFRIFRRSRPKKLKFAFFNDPSSRSTNILGFRRCYGLPRVDRVINIFEDLYLVQSKKMSDISQDGKEFRKHESYWFMMKGDMILDLSEPLERALLEQEWTKIKSCKTIYGNCKLSLQKIERDEETGMLKQETRMVKIIECSQKGDLIEERNIKVQGQKSLLQEEILMNFADDELLVKVSYQKNKGQILSGTTSESTIQTLTINSKKQQQYAFVGRKVFWNQCVGKRINMYDLISQTHNKLQLPCYEGQENFDQLILSACSPFQFIRQSFKNTLDAETMVWQSNHLQVTTKNDVYIFDCNNPEPVFVKSMINNNELSDPEKHVESSIAIVQNEGTNNFWTNFRPNQQGSMVEERMTFIEKEAMSGQIDLHTPPIDLEDNKMIGLYRTFSSIDIYTIHFILKYKKIRNHGLEMRVRFQTLFALFGQQTMPQVFNVDLRLLMSLQQHIQDFEIAENAPDDQYSANEVRLTNMMTNFTHVVESEEDAPAAKLSSFFRNNLASTSLRDVLTNIGWQSRKFSICNVLTDQIDSQKMLKASTASSTEELNKFYIETAWTRAITSFKLPSGMENLVIQRKDINITRKDIEDQLEQDNDEPQNLELHRVSLKMIEMPWFFAKKSNFVSFSQYLRERPNKVYNSLLVESILTQNWEEKQQEMIYKQFLPFITFAVLSVLQFMYMLDGHDETEKTMTGRDWLNLLLSMPIFVLWCYLVNNERKQVKDSVGFEYLTSLWNWIDMMNLSLTALVVVASFEPFAFLEVETLRAFASVAAFLLMAKVFDWLRLFESTAEYVLLIQETIMDTGVFIILIFFALMMFGIPMIILNENRDETNAINGGPIGIWFFDMLIDQYLLALGEWGNTRGNFAEGPQTRLIYIFFLLATFISLVTMLNMLIAIMGDTFDRMMENKDINSVRSKLELVADLVAILGQEDSEEERRVFFFVLETVKNEEDNDEQDEWQGTIKTMTRVFKQNNQALKKTIIDQTAKMEVYLNDLRISDEVQDLACRDQIELSVKKNSNVFRTHLEEIDKHMESMFNEILLSLKEKNEKKVLEKLQETSAYPKTVQEAQLFFSDI